MITIYIKDILVEAKHGVSLEERQRNQRFKVTLQISLDAARAESSDNIDDTLDWSLLRSTVISIIEQQSFHLMERLAAEIADKLMKDERINSLTLTIEKIDAFDSGVPGVVLTRIKNS